jgi:hypothetical protein
VQVARAAEEFASAMCYKLNMCYKQNTASVLIVARTRGDLLCCCIVKAAEFVVNAEVSGKRFKRGISGH